MEYIFDTNIFDEIFDENIDTSHFKEKLTCCATHIQRDEIEKIPEVSRKESLKKVFRKVIDVQRLTEICITGVSRSGEARLGDAKTYMEIKERLDKIKKRPNNQKDAIIGITCLKNNLTLVTHDMAFFKVMTEHKCAVSNIYQFLKVHQL